MDEYRAQLIAVEAKLAKSPEDEGLIEYRNELLELIESLESLEAEEQKNQPTTSIKDSSHRKSDELGSDDPLVANPSGQAAGSSGQTIASGTKRPLSEAELLAKKREKNRKKKAKLREKHKEQLDTAESVKQSWQSFASKPGLKGITKHSIFASPYSLTGKVGVGTNGIADRVTSVVGGASSSATGPISKQRNRH